MVSKYALRDWIDWGMSFVPILKPLVDVLDYNAFNWAIGMEKT